MEGLAPPLELLMVVRQTMERGDSVRLGILEYVQSRPSDFARFVAQWLFCIERGGETDEWLSQLSPHRRVLLEVLHRGLQGQSIHTTLKRMEEEIFLAAEREIAEFHATLPIRLLFPLLLLIFPAFLIMLLGPLTLHFLRSLS